MNIAMVAQGLPPSLILPNAPEDRRCPQKWRPDGNPSAPSKIQISTAASLDSKIRPSLSSILTSAAVALSLLCSPSSSLAIPYPISSSSSPLTTSTPYFQAQNQQFGLEDGKIRPCPSMNPGCISTNPKSSSFAFPWIIPQTDAENPLQKIEDAIRKTQGNPKIRARESTPYGSAQQAILEPVSFPCGPSPTDILSQPVAPTISLPECPPTSERQQGWRKAVSTSRS
ncbi:thylakoid lumenal 17.9 kDa protein, chloroplastic isoform X2 [Nymphaea colorata]|uniref:thylakoid lumenal 17.9 kDa protein, chloroplastic isoform X2 n=1 Tax=Nymphaea colorata TaxID=210225 RepID=UPI00129E12EF|nr:thylakoid lumenal 17.9 kDa protein, chloroplastic isoform X2 [Nymphaea colorata]